LSFSAKGEEGSIGDRKRREKESQVSSIGLLRVRLPPEKRESYHYWLKWGSLQGNAKKKEGILLWVNENPCVRKG